MKKWNIVCAITVLVFSVIFFCFNGPLQAASLEWSGCIEVDLRGSEQGDADSNSEIVLDTLELVLEAEVNENVSAMAIVKYEGGDDDVFLDEANLTLSKVGGAPLNVTAGKYVLPFGVFESHLISDPLTQDKYEINASGVSLAYAPEEMKGLELSLTVYDEPVSDDDVTDYILDVSFAQEELVNLSVYYNSVKGAEDRNDTMGVSVNAAVQNLTLDLEYITALEREGVNPPEESAYSVSAAYQALPALELAARYEGYDDDTVNDNDLFDGDTMVGLETKYSLGASYEVFENAALSAEYRVTSYEVDDDLKEWALRLSVEF